MNLEVLLVDDHPVLRKGLRLLLEEEEDLTVVGEAGDGREAIELFRQLTPDVVVMDITMKGLNGIEATRHIVTESPATKVLALSIHSGRRFVEDMLDAGAAGYLLKDSAPEELVEGIRAVVRGEVYLSPAITGIVVSQYKSKLRRKRPLDGFALPTERERDILRRVAEGDSDEQIAAALHLDEDTVATARRRLMDELGAHDDAGFVEAAGELGLLADEAELQGQPERLRDPEPAATRIRRTRLHRPPIPEGHVHRPRLLERLEKGRVLPLTLISAPAGYGKSILAACWVSTCGLPAAWFSLNEDDNDLRQFLHYFLTAVRSVFPDAAEKTRSLAGAAILPPLSVLSAALVNDLDEIDEDFVLVLDDFHRIREEPVHNLITELLRYPPIPLHLVVITRRDPPLPLTKLRADGQVNEVRVSDLRFTGAETAELLKKVTGLTLSDDALAQLGRQLEGWVVGLRLVALALGQVDSPEELLKGMSGGIPQVQEYLLQEVIAHRSPQMQDWLLKTSILDRFCEPLCTAVCAVDAPPGSTDLDGGQFIDALLRCNLFTIPLDTEGKWFRYHHLFQKLIRSQLVLQMDPKEVAALRLRAGDWFEKQGLIEEAIEHYVESGQLERSADVIERNARSALDSGAWYVIAGWLSKLPESVIEVRTELLLARAITNVLLMDLEGIPPILNRIDNLMGGDPQNHTLAGEVALLRGVCAFFRADGARSLEALELGLMRTPTTRTFLRSINEVFYMVASQMEGLEDRAREEAAAWLGAETPLHPLRETHLRKACSDLDLISGDLEAVKRNAVRTRDLAITHKLDNYVAWCDYHAGLGLLLQGDFDAAIRFLEAAGERKYFHNARAAIDAMAALTIAYQSRGITGEASPSLQSLREFVHHLDPSFAIIADSCATRLQIMQGQSEVAVWETKSGPSVPKQPMAIWFEIPLITRCRALVADATGGGLDEAQERLQIYIEFNEAHHNTCHLIGLTALQAIAFDKQNKPEEALAALERAVDLGRPGGFIFPFLELGPPMADLLRRLPEQDTNTAYVERILSALGDAEKNAATDAGRHQANLKLPEILSNRELEVLELLAQRLRDKEIAAKLFVSTQTVNSHCKSIYQKLDVSNRRQAVAKGADLGIL